MLRHDYYAPLCAMTAVLALVCAGCGGNKSSSTNLSQAQAQAVSQELTNAVEQALNNTFSTSAAAQSSAHSRLAEAVAGIHPEDASSCLTGSTIDCTINSSASCPQGGTVSVSGTINGTLDNGSGSVNATLTATPAGCGVDGLTINGDPDVAFATSLDITSDNVDFPVTATTTGGISYGPNPSGSCTMSLTFTVNSLSSCSVSGSLCGQSVNGSC